MAAHPSWLLVLSLAVLVTASTPAGALRTGELTMSSHWVEGQPPPPAAAAAAAARRHSAEIASRHRLEVAAGHRAALPLVV